MFTQEVRAAYVLLLLQVLWLTEVVPLEVGAMLPFALLPLFQLMDPDDVIGVYINASTRVLDQPRAEL